MNLDERAELAFKHHIDNYGVDWGSNCELFSAGYRAAMRSLYVEVDSNEMVVGRFYWVGGMIGEMQGFRSITAKSGIAVRWPIVNGQTVCPDQLRIRGPIPNGSELTSPAEIFGGTT